MPDFYLFKVLAALALLVALTSIPLAARRASRSAWSIQAAAALVVSLNQAVMFWRFYQPYASTWRCLAAGVVATLLPTLAAAWCARAAMRAWPGRPYVSATVGALIGFGLASAVAIVATPRLLPDMINAVQ